MKREIKLEENCTKAYSLLEGQCIKSMKAKVRGHPNYAQIEATYDFLLLLRTMQVIDFKF